MNHLRILLVEDIKVNATLAKILLERKGHTVKVAWNGNEAIETFLSGEFDVILMDIQMPGISGIEATEEIRKREKKSSGETRVPIIAMTGGVTKEEKESYLAAGMDAVVEKPLDPEELFSTIEQVVS